MTLQPLLRWLGALGVAAMTTSGAASAADVHVMISAGFYQAYSELVPAFEHSSGHRVLTTRGPSLGDSPESIPARLKRGEPADLVIIVGASIDDLARQGLVNNAKETEAAQALARFLASPQAAAAIIKSGLSPVAQP